MANTNGTMAMGNDGTYMKKITFLISTSTFFALALLSAITYIIFTLHRTRSVKTSTVFLLVSILTLAASIATIHLGLSDIYLATALSSTSSPNPPSASAIATAESSLRYTTAASCLLWTAIFATKSSIVTSTSEAIDTLARRSTRRKIYQHAVLAATVATWAFHLAIPFIACQQHTGEAALSCPTHPTATAKMLSTISTALDILTTLFVLALPAHNLLTQRPSSQKPRLSLSIPILTIAALALTTTLPSLLRPTLHPSSPPFTLHLLSLEASSTLLLTSLFLTRSPSHSLRNTRPTSPASHHRWRPGTLTARLSRSRSLTESQERLRAPPPSAAAVGAAGGAGAVLPLPVIEPGLHTVIASEGRRTPTRLVKASLRRQESVLRTREVRVEVHYGGEGDGCGSSSSGGGGEVWGRVASPSWVDEKWRVRPESEGSMAGGV